MFKITLLTFLCLTSIFYQSQANKFTDIQNKVQEFIDIVQQHYSHLLVEEIDYELMAGYALTQVKFLNIDKAEVITDKSDVYGFTLSSEKFVVELTITGGYVVPLVIEGLYASVALRGPESDSKIEDFELNYENAYVDSNFIVSTITSYVFSKTLLEKYLYQARVAMKFYIYKAMQYNGDLINLRTGAIEREDPMIWFSQLTKIDGIKIKDKTVIANLEDMFHLKQKSKANKKKGDL